MHRLDDMKYREIAERLGISQSAVEKHIAKAALFLTEWTLVASIPASCTATRGAGGSCRSLARLHAEDRDAADEAGFRAWLEASPDHAAAFDSGGPDVERCRRAEQSPP